MSRILRKWKWLLRAGVIFIGVRTAIHQMLICHPQFFWLKVNLPCTVLVSWQNVRSGLMVASTLWSEPSNGFEEIWPRTKLSKKYLLSPHFQPSRTSSATSVPGLRWPLIHALVCARIWLKRRRCLGWLCLHPNGALRRFAAATDARP